MTPQSVLPIEATTLSPLVLRQVEQYESVGHRSRFLWKWASRGIGQTTLSAVPMDAREDLSDTKLLAVILNVLLDDIADLRGDGTLLELALGIPLGAAGPDLLSQVPVEDRPYIQCIVDTWSALWERVQRLPFFPQHREMLTFDYGQVLNCMRYGLLLKHRPHMMNVTENAHYQPHNMNMMVFATLDLMASPDIDHGELGRLRSAFTHAQAMGQISNMLVTWQREVKDHDFSSRIFALGLHRGVFTPSDFRSLSSTAFEERIRATGLEDTLRREWTAHHDELVHIARSVRSVDLLELCAGLRALLNMTLAARGHL